MRDHRQRSGINRCHATHVDEPDVIADRIWQPAPRDERSLETTRAASPALRAGGGHARVRLVQRTRAGETAIRRCAVARIAGGVLVRGVGGGFVEPWTTLGSAMASVD